jgi:hypothetical protein
VSARVAVVFPSPHPLTIRAVEGEQLCAAVGERTSTSRTHQWPAQHIAAVGVGNGRYVTFQMADVAMPWELFGEILRLIDGLRPKPAPA